MDQNEDLLYVDFLDDLFHNFNQFQSALDENTGHLGSHLVLLVLLEEEEEGAEDVRFVAAFERLDHGVVEVVNDGLTLGLLVKAWFKHPLAELLLEGCDSQLVKVAHDFLEFTSFNHDSGNTLSESVGNLFSLKSVIQNISESVDQVVGRVFETGFVLLDTPDYLV